MHRLDVSGAVRPIYGSLGVKRLTNSLVQRPPSEAKSSSANKKIPALSTVAIH